MSIKNFFFAPLSKGLGATRRAAVLLLVMLLTMAQTAWADGISYLDATGTQQSCTTYTTVESSSTFWNSGWFVVNSNTTISDRITVSGTVNLILTNNATLTASKGITVGSDATLNIYAQTDDEATMGALVASGANDNQQYNAGIGGVDNTAAGTITINGGKINATGKVGAGIGSGGQSGATVGTITINGGIVTAQDGDGYGAGIGGGGILGKASTINLNGGIINAAGIGSGYLGGDCSITVNISDGIRKIVATPVQGGACIGKGKSASGSVTVNFISGGNIVTGDDKDAVFYDTDEGSERQIRTKALNHTVSMSDDLKAHITVSTELAITGETVTLTLGTAVDASTLKVNDGTSDLTLTDAGNRNYTFTMPAGNVTVTASTATTYSVNLPANMEIVSATNTADGSGKYISGMVVTFKASFSYTASNVYDGANTLTADDSGNYSVTVGTADITVTATIEHSSNIDLSQSPSDFTVVDGNVLTGSTSHTVTIANGASIMLNDATITGGIVCAGTAEITLVGTNSVTGASYKAGIQVGGSGTTLTIKGNGSLTANGGDQSAGIGLSRAWNPANDVIGGDIIIEGGNITANGSVNDKWGAGIGTGVIKGGTAMLGTITIKGGSVKATGGSEADGIGTGFTYYGCTNTIGTVTIYDGIDMVDASSIKNFNNVIYMHGETNVTASKSDYFTIGEDGNRRLIVQKPVIADIPDQTYTGSAITPEPTVFAGSLSLTKGTDYVYSYTNNTNVGTAKVRATFQGTYASLGYVEKEFTILPSSVMVSVTGSGTVTCGDRSATDGTSFGVMSEKGASVVLTLAPTDGYAVRSVAYGYTNNSGTTAIGLKLPINGSAATLTVPNDLKDGTYVNLTVTFVSALAGGADEASAVALTDATVTDLGGGWYKVDSDISFDHTLNLLGDTHLIIDDGKTMTVNTATGEGILSDYTLFVSGEGTLSVATTGDYGIAVCVGNYVQTGATVTASGYIGIRCADDFLGFDFDNDFTFSGGQLTATGNSGGIWADNDITLSCTNATDFIQASSYSSGYGAVKIADGKALTDGTEASNGMNGYSGTLTYEQRTAIGGKTLHRAVTTSYVEASGTLHENVIAIPLDNTMTTLAAGWYVVNEDVTFTSKITLNGDVNLILGDGKTMTVTNTGTDVKDRAIYGDEKTLHIYGQSQGTGALTATAVGGESAIFLGISDDNAGSLLGIHGGVVSASTECASGVAISVQCATDAGGIVIDGGQVTASGKSYGIFCFSGHFDVIGGQVTATGTNGYGLGICDYGTNPGVLTLGYSKASDFVSTNSIYNYSGESSAGEVKIADDQTLVDGNGNIWSGTLSNDEIQSIRNQTLRPVTGVALTKDGNNVSATFDGTSTTTMSIPVDVNVTSVTYNRAFTMDKPSTVMLPFSKDVGEIGGGTFYTFGGVEKKNNKWVATMNAVTGSLTANTPYLFVPAGTSLTFTGGATLNTTGGGNCLASDAEGWEFHGTYSKKIWNEVETHDYGFAATSGTSADNQDVEAGQFVRLTTGASAKPMRCYLSYVGGPAQARALTRGAAATDEELPSSIIVRLVGANGQTTAIGTIDTKTGEMTFFDEQSGKAERDSEAWYTLDGVRLSGKPTKKGLYINNGKKIVIK